MKRWVTKDDVIDVWHKSKQRGFGFLLSKLNIYGIQRTEHTFNQSDYQSADWWIIPMVKSRWNSLITGDAELDYKAYLVDHILQDKKGLRLLSLGSGASRHELELAKYPNFDELVCVDLAKDRLQEAEAEAKELGLTNIKFICADVHNFEIPKAYYDVVFFHASLHHFDEMDDFIVNKVKPALKPDGLLVINEYVGPTRLQFPKHQIAKINEALHLIPEVYRTRFKSKLIKRTFHGSGILRMIVADPSECVDSARILPAIHAHFDTLIQKPYGGNILMNVLKDIAHHFVEVDQEKTQVLRSLFALEDAYLEENPSDFIFGVYQVKS